MGGIVFINRVYPPEGGATGVLLRELAEGLVEEGRRVAVLTGGGGKFPRREMVNGVEVMRAWSPRLQRGSHWRRALGYAVLYPQLAWMTLRVGKVDTIVTMTDPPMQMVLQPWVGARKARRIHWAQDVYPDLAERLEVIRRAGWVVRGLTALANGALRRHHDIVVPGRCMKEVLVRRGLEAGKIEVISNWSSIERASVEEIAAMRERLGWGDDFVVLYSGNMGLAHDFGTIVEAILKGGWNEEKEGRRVRFVFAGEGPRLVEVRKALAGVERVDFLSSQKFEDLGAFFGAADVHLVTVREGLEGLVVPSKAYGVWAVGKAMIYVGEEGGEVAQVLRETGTGAVVGNGDVLEFISTVKELRGDLKGIVLMEENALRISEEFSFLSVLEKWRGIF